MKKYMKFLSLFCFIFLFGLIGCTRVGVGSVGLKVSQAGSDRGMQDIPMKTGWVFYNPLFTDIIEYPTFVQTAVWTHEVGEGNPINEEMTFNSKDGMLFHADVNVSYHLEADKAAHFYVKYKAEDISHFTHGLMRQIARDEFNNTASTYTAEDLYGPKKEEFVNTVKTRINNVFKDNGIVVESLGFVGALRPPDQFVAAINAKLTATQDAIKAENQLRETKANAEKTIAEAEGKAKAMAAQNNAITPQMLELKRIELQHAWVQKWNGAPPQTMITGGGNSGSVVPFFDIKK